MKILIYAHHFPPQSGGMEYSNLEISKGLHSLGHHVEVVACRNKGIESFVSALDFQVNFLPKWPRLSTYSLHGAARANWLFMNVYRSILMNKINWFKPDIIFVSDETSNCFWGSLVENINLPYISYCSVPFLAVNGRKGRFGYVSDIKYTLNKFINERYKKYMSDSYCYAKRIIVVSQSTKNELLKIAPQFSSKIDIIPRSISDSYFDNPVKLDQIRFMRKKMKIKTEDIVLLSASSLIMSKGIDDVLAAIGKLRRSVLKKIKYLIVGGGPKEGYFREIVKKLHIEEHVIFVGQVDNEKLIDYYDLCDFFVLPSKKGKEESFGRVFVEAAARSKPSIGVNQGGMVDVIDDGQNGYLVPLGDTNRLKECIAILSSDEGKRKDFGFFAREKAENNYRSEIIARKFDAVFHDNAEIAR